MFFTLKSDGGLGTSTIQLRKMWLPVQLCRAPYRRIGITSPVPFLGAITNCEKRLLPSSCLPVRLSVRNNSLPNGRIVTKFGNWVFFENLSRKLKFV
jgi:hypothetical protein